LARSTLRRIVVYALVDVLCRDAVELYVRRKDAEQDLADAVADEPEWCGQLAVVELDFGEFSAS